MKVSDFIERQGFNYPIKNCRITDLSDEILEGPDVGMLCTIKTIQRYPNYDEDNKKAYKVYLDYSEYEAYNKSISTTRFYDDNGSPTLTWFESKNYRNTDDLIIYDSDEIEDYFVFEYTSTWKIELHKVSQCPQRQDSIVDQLKDLVIIANRFGFYDAADAIKKTIGKN